MKNKLTPDPVFDVSGDAPPWTMQSDEFYVRDVSGKEIALYSGSSLTQCSNGVPTGEHLGIG